MASFFVKDPDSVLDYQENWATWLGTDTITTSTWTVPTGITKDSDTNTTTTTTIWLSGGTAEQAYSLVNRIVTTDGRTSERAIVVYVKERVGDFTYRGDLSTNRDKVRFYVNDTTESDGPKPGSGNFTDEEIDGLVTAEGSWQRAVAAIFEVLAGTYAQLVDITVGPRRESLSQTAGAYQSLAQMWRQRHGGGTSAGSRFATRVDGYSDDVAADET